MAGYRRLIAAASIAALVFGLGACSRPTPTAGASDAGALQYQGSIQHGLQATGGDDRPGPQAQNGGCYQVVTGGGYVAGVNGGPGIMTPGQTSTICPPPPIQAQAPVAAAVPAPPLAAAPAPARAEPAAPDTD